MSARDITRVYRGLQNIGVSQQRIGWLTEQTQGEVSAITRGRRKIVAYGLLERIVEGLGIPRSLAGICRFDQCDRAELLAALHSTPDGAETDTTAANEGVVGQTPRGRGRPVGTWKS